VASPTELACVIIAPGYKTRDGTSATVTPCEAGTYSEAARLPVAATTCTACPNAAASTAVGAACEQACSGGVCPTAAGTAGELLRPHIAVMPACCCNGAFPLAQKQPYSGVPVRGP
jgi:hypothetical protein